MTTTIHSTMGPKRGTAIRQRGQERVRDILAEAQRLLVNEGYAGLTTRKVARNLGISIGNLTYYFPTKETLLEALITNLLEQYRRAMDVARQTFPNDPRGRFLAYLDYLIADCLNSDTRATFFQIWGLATHNEMVRTLRNKIYDEAIAAASEVVRPLHPGISDKQLNNLAVTLVALIEGLHVMFDLDETSLPVSTDYKAVIQGQILSMVLKGAP